MSRAFGDLPCRRLGVQPEPEVTVVDLGRDWGLQKKGGRSSSGGGGRGGGEGGGGEGVGARGEGGGEEELMVVIASDGVWEYMGE